MLQPKRSFLIIALVVLAGTGTMISGSAWAGHKCPNRFFKRVKASGVGDSEANAKTAYVNDVKNKADTAKADCKDCECEETAETCTFKYTYKTKPGCKPGAGGGFECKGWLRPGCFCMEQDEDFLAVSGGGATGESPAPSEKKKE